MDNRNMLEPRTWEEFRESGFFFFTNYILQLFGWCIVIEKEEGKITRCYPARTHYRGFSDDAVTDSNKKMLHDILMNIPDLYKDYFETENKNFKKE
jgi:hypothetical protein